MFVPIYNILCIQILKELFLLGRINTTRGLNVINAAIIYQVNKYIKFNQELKKYPKITQSTLSQDFKCSEVTLRKELKHIETIFLSNSEFYKNLEFNKNLNNDDNYFYNKIPNDPKSLIPIEELISLVKFVFKKDKHQKGSIRMKYSKESLRPLSELKSFIKHTMRMSHIYQPLIIKNLLQSNGIYSIDMICEQLAEILDGDKNHYAKRIVLAPKDVLESHNVAKFEVNKIRLLFDISENNSQKKKIIEICQNKIDTYLDNNQSSGTLTKEFHKYSLSLYNERKSLDSTFLRFNENHLKNFNNILRKNFTLKRLIIWLQKDGGYKEKYFLIAKKDYLIIRDEYFEEIFKKKPYFSDTNRYYCICGKSYHKKSKTFLISHLKNCQKALNYKRVDENLLENTQISKVSLKLDFSPFKQFKYHSALTCFLIDKWNGISPDIGIINYYSNDYWLKFYRHFNLEHNLLTDVKSHRLQIMNIFSGELVKSDSISYNRQTRQFGTKFKFGKGIWNIGYSEKKEVKLAKNYIEFIKNKILKEEKIALIPFIKILYNKTFFESIDEMKVIANFTKDFNINEQEFFILFSYDSQLETQIRNIYNKKELINIAHKNKKIKEQKILDKKLSMKNVINQEFMKVINSTEILGPSQFKKDDIKFFLDFYTHQFSKEIFTEEDFENYFYEYFDKYFIQGVSILFYLMDSRYGRLHFFTSDGINKYKMSAITAFINSMKITPKEKTFLHLVIRIPHFLVFCIIFAYSDYALKTKEEIQLFKKRMKLDTKQDFLIIYKGVYKNSNPVGKLQRYYFNMLDWLDVLEFTAIIDNSITPSQILKNFIYGETSGEFSLPNKIRRIIEDVINDLEV